MDGPEVQGGDPKGLSEEGNPADRPADGHAQDHGGFGAENYAFFGAAEDDEGLGGLEGGLEDDLEVPPKEEVPLDEQELDFAELQDVDDPQQAALARAFEGLLSSDDQELPPGHQRLQQRPDASQTQEPAHQPQPSRQPFSSGAYDPTVIPPAANSLPPLGSSVFSSNVLGGLPIPSFSPPPSQLQQQAQGRSAGFPRSISGSGGSFDAYSQSSSRAPSLNSMQRQQLSAALNSSPEQQRLSSSYPPGVAGVPLGGSDPNYAQLLREHQLRLAQHQQQQEQQRRLVGSQGQLLAASQGGNLSVSELERQLLLQQHREQAAAAQGLYGAQVQQPQQQQPMTVADLEARMAQSIAQMAASSQSPPPAGFPRAGPQHLPGQVQLPPHLQAQLPHAQLPLPQPQLPFGFPGGPPGRAPPHAAASSYLGSLGLGAQRPAAAPQPLPQLRSYEALQRAAAGRGIPSNTAGNYTLPELNLLQQQQQQQQQQARALPFPLGVLERRSPEGPYPGGPTGAPHTAEWVRQQQAILQQQRQQEHLVGLAAGRAAGPFFQGQNAQVMRYPPGIRPPGPAGYGLTALARHRAQGSKHMDAEEIEAILRLQWKTLHSASPYQEDYYYQAFMDKNVGGRFFAPDALRELAPAERAAHEPQAYAKLEGLGKIAFSNIRRPKPLMEVAAARSDSPASSSSSAAGSNQGEAEGQGEGEGERRALEDEPLLAARMVVEDCMCLLLDVDDIDRLWAAAGGGSREDEHALRQRRALLMDAFAASMRIPDTALLPPRSPPATSPRSAAEPVEPAAAADAVFAHCMSLHKGRSLLARALKLLHAPLATADGLQGPAGRRPPPLKLAWALLRNVRLLFSLSPLLGSSTSSHHLSKGADRAAAEARLYLIDITSHLAAACVEVMRRLESPRAVCDCMAALIHGDLAPEADGGSSTENAPEQPEEAAVPSPLLPLRAPRAPQEPQGTRRDWLAEITVALLQKAQELGLAEFAAERPPIASSAGILAPEGQAWHECFGSFFQLLLAHMRALQQAAKSGGTDAVQARQDVPINLIRATLPHATEAQRDALKASLSHIT